MTEITPELLEAAYRQGLFPMGDPETGELRWYQPDPRAVFELDDFHVPHRLAKTMRGGRLRFTIDAAFDDVIRRCGRWDTPEEVWITPGIVDLYCRMNELDKAHSIEAWVGEELAGGLYGMAFGGAFMGESMFHTVRDASKACLVFLVEHLRQRGYVLLDTQFATEHLEQFGVTLIPHVEYLRRLERALELPCTFR
jgi:leucyl/phenylalanyl-tRNA--protein transferase